MIVFTYKVAEFLNNAQIIALYRANALLQHGEEIPLDDSAATYEDDSILKNYLKKGAALIAASIAGYTKDLFDTDGTLLDAFEFISAVPAVEANEQANPPVLAQAAIEAQIIFRINLPKELNSEDVPVEYPNTILLSIDEAIKDALESYMLYRLFKIKGHNFESFMDDFKEATSKILGYINRRTKTTRRSYNMF